MVSVGRRILGKAETIEDAAACLRLLSGRAHRVHTGVVLVSAAGQLRRRLVETRVRFKRLSREDVDSYLASGEWRGKAGGYAVQGIAGAFVVKLSGSYSNVVGLPLYETMTLLDRRGLSRPLQLAELRLSGRATTASRGRRDRAAAGRRGKCPICGKPSDRAVYPFCSKRCATIDLNRWLSGSYAIPAVEEDDPDTEEGEGGDRHE